MFRNLLRKEDVLKMLVTWLEKNRSAIAPHYGYSGRGMFGRKCFGLEGSDTEIQTALMDFVADNPQTLGIVRNLIKGQQRDNMGLSMIVYFPDVDIQAEG